MDLVRAKKSLGQHFLTDHNIAGKIAQSVPDSGLPLLEIGPGMGMLTRFLLEKPNELKVIEIDSESVAYLKQRFQDFPAQNILHADFLTIHPDEIFQQEFGVVGNFPYNISSQILFRVLEFRSRIPLLCGMFQKEVAQRVVAGHGSKTYGILSVLIQTWYDARILFPVSEKVFNPPPKVQSAVILLTRKNNPPLIGDPDLYIRMVKAAFNQRRKMLKNPLSAHFRIPVNTSYNSCRAEQLSLEDFKKLYDEIVWQYPRGAF
ncbi:MAG TPA: 16S rRNA (adenine(1518)-N(6)/adenine(1519)-N(6))-dimethyltransferase RsmA [Bacteroidales bacterium]|nr:16S rRNA (adenine(1518)-N(6)/adenine(1519)-N(6))-dimethyltransferase RsmA [Bacteroidales bacterium]HRZ48301.1 16S rRNA (adenine(1518)-N(6)/adenine(1519)-N(6))-dimethyltransferase RsmA [Bacteroidales bacterium]